MLIRICIMINGAIGLNMGGGVFFPIGKKGLTNGN